jgi:hypothetical protein
VTWRLQILRSLSIRESPTKRYSFCDSLTVLGNCGGGRRGKALVAARSRELELLADFLGRCGRISDALLRFVDIAIFDVVKKTQKDFFVLVFFCFLFYVPGWPGREDMDILTQSLNISERQRNKTQTSALSKAWSNMLDQDTSSNLKILEASRTR